MVKGLELKMNSPNDHPFYEMLSYLTEADLASNEFSFLSNEDKKLILVQHAKNVKAFKHTMLYALKTYSVLSDAYNKYKHGFLFLFAMGSFAPLDMTEFARAR